MKFLMLPFYFFCLTSLLFSQLLTAIEHKHQFEFLVTDGGAESGYSEGLITYKREENDKKIHGVGFSVFYASSEVESFKSLPIFEQGFLGQSIEMDDIEDLDNNIFTDKRVLLTWFSSDQPLEMKDKIQLVEFEVKTLPNLQTYAGIVLFPKKTPGFYSYKSQSSLSADDIADKDQDGVGDLADNCPAIANPKQENTDLTDDGGDVCDMDDDNDGLTDTFELANDLNPLDAQDALQDKDLDGLSNIEEFILGTNINLADTDGDGIADNVDTNPLVFDEVDAMLYSGQVVILPDINGDNVQEIGVLQVLTQDGTVVLQVLNGVDQQNLSTIVWSDGYEDTSLALHVVPDLNGNGVAEAGLFGVRDTVNNEGKPQMFVRDLQTGARVSVINWPANWREVSARVLPDMTGDDLAEIGLQGRFKEGYRPQLVVKNGVTSAGVDTFGYPSLFNAPQFYAHSDVNGDGVAEIATFGRVSRNNKIQVKIASGVDAKDRLKAYNFPDKWSDVSWHRLDDSNGDGIDDWGLFGTSKIDGRPQLINKDGVSPIGALRIFAWPSVMQDAQFFRIPDMNNDGVDDVAAAGRRSNNGRYQFQIQDGTDRNVVLANHNLNLSLTNVTYHVLPDLSGDGMVEIGFMGINPEGEYELVIQHGDTLNGEYASHNLGSDWAQAPSITSLGDIDNDGLMNLLIYGQDSSAETLRINNY